MACGSNKARLLSSRRHMPLARCCCYVYRAFLPICYLAGASSPTFNGVMLFSAPE